MWILAISRMALSSLLNFDKASGVHPPSDVRASEISVLILSKSDSGNTASSKSVCVSIIELHHLELFAEANKYVRNSRRMDTGKDQSEHAEGKSFDGLSSWSSGDDKFGNDVLKKFSISEPKQLLDLTLFP